METIKKVEKTLFKITSKRVAKNIKKLKTEDEYNILDFLVSPLKIDFEFEKWTLKEIAIFECCICLFGKKFDFIHKILKKKKFTEIVLFYNLWKKSSHYVQWKRHYNELKRNNNVN